MSKGRKIYLSIIYVLMFLLIAASFFFYVYNKLPLSWGINPAYFSYGCVAGAFLLSLLALQKKARNIFVALGLACTCVADFFLILSPALGLIIKNSQLIGVCVFCGVQAIFFVYTLILNKGIGTKVFNMALRVALCLIAYFVLPKYFTIGTLEMISLMYILNSFATLLMLLIYIKKEWLLFLGFLLFFVCDIFIGLASGGAAILGITGPFLDFILKYNIGMYCYIPGLFLIASSAVWTKKE
ncbi:MAG: hypothetical protein E7375_03475 [Clostridiales bacterium]|nr:hypothetical protein [Clostridiales bacterium]